MRHVVIPEKFINKSIRHQLVGDQLFIYILKSDQEATTAAEQPSVSTLTKWEEQKEWIENS